MQQESLTDREREIAALIAQFMTNEDIAGRLCISSKTVEFHVSNVLGKLDMHSRRDIARWFWKKHSLLIHADEELAMTN